MKLIKPYEHLLLAVSGGVDSMVMFHYLATQAEALHIKLSVAHMDHQKREDSPLDHKLIADVCKKYSINLYTKKLEKNEADNFHDYAHLKRYEFFAETARKILADKIVLAHNANDNAETILMRLARGSSFEGYRGILAETKFQDIKVIRPMLKITKEDIKAYQEENSIAYNEDSSNEEDNYTRNRYRHHILPLLAAENPKYLEKFNQFADYQTKAYKLVEKMTDFYISDHMIRYKNALAFDVGSFLDADQIVQIESIKYVVNKLTANTIELSYTNIMDIVKLFYNEKPHVELLLSENLYIHKSYNLVYFENKKPAINDFSYTIEEYQEIILPDGSLLVVTENPNKYYGIMFKLCYNNLDLIFPLTVRTRIEGDKIKTTAGTKKLKDVFINEKIPMKTRNVLPIVLDKNQNILWIPRIFKSKTTGKKTMYVIYQEGKNNA